MNFHHTDERDPHRSSGALLRAHPEIRSLFGPTRWTALVVLGAAGLAFLLAAAAAVLPAWAAALLAIGPGAFLAHALYAAIHECSHDLVFSWRPGNALLALLANAPLVFPFAPEYMREHLLHHRHLGQIGRDPDLPAPWERRLAGPLGKLLWLLLSPLAQALRGRLRVDRWAIANLMIQIAVGFTVGLGLGWGALLYLAGAMLASMILPPGGARYLQEHFVIREGQETYSYYGPLNPLALNVGYHNEHHDFPHVPWTRLPRLRALLRARYDALASHRSWLRVWWRFLFDPRLGVHSRYARPPRVAP